MSGLDGLGWPDEAEAGPLVVRSIAEYGPPKEPGIYWILHEMGTDQEKNVAVWDGKIWRYTDNAPDYQWHELYGMKVLAWLDETPAPACTHRKERHVGITAEGMGNIIVHWCPDCGALKRTMTNWMCTDYPWAIPAQPPAQRDRLVEVIKSRDADRVYLDKQWNELRDHRDRLLELLRQSQDALWRARSDIWQTARVSEYNLTGKDPLFPNDRPNTPPDPPMTVTRAGLDQSYKVIEYLEETVKLLAAEFKEENVEVARESGEKRS